MIFVKHAVGAAAPFWVFFVSHFPSRLVTKASNNSTALLLMMLFVVNVLHFILGQCNILNGAATVTLGHALAALFVRNIKDEESGEAVGLSIISVCVYGVLFFSLAAAVL